jgi:choline dehydrogenase
VKQREYDVVIVGGGSPAASSRTGLSADPATSVLVLEAGRPDSLWDVYVHMPAALSFPIGNSATTGRTSRSRSRS